MARTALRAGRSVVIANSRGPGSLTSVVSTLGAGASAGTVDQASAAGIVVIAVRWPASPEAVRGLEWNGQIVIDATNDFDPGDLIRGGELQQIRGPLAGVNLIRLP
jgi:predicted dinucleotide-binding enzyme